MEVTKGWGKGGVCVMEEHNECITSVFTNTIITKSQSNLSQEELKHTVNYAHSPQFVT